MQADDIRVFEQLQCPDLPPYLLFVDHHTSAKKTGAAVLVGRSGQPRPAAAAAEEMEREVQPPRKRRGEFRKKRTWSLKRRERILLRSRILMAK